MELLLYTLIFFISCFVLVRAGTWLIQALTRISQFLKWKEFFVSFILMAFASALPEFFIGISSAFHKIPELSLGNIIGANIINLTLVFGICAILAGGLKMESAVAKKDSLYTAFIAILPVIALLDGFISRADAIILIIVTLFYFNQVFSQKTIFSRVFKNGFRRRTKRAKKRFLLDIFIFFFSLIFLLASAEGIIRSSTFFAERINLPLIFIGVFLVSIGTVLPELTFGIKSIMMGHKEMMVGNIMGSVVIHSSLILGTVALISPIKIDNFSPLIISIVFTFISAVFFYAFLRYQEQVSRKEGFFLIIIYFLFIIFEITARFW
ncbi:MAG: hypothetical protein PHN37_03265 [Candidatus Pacebacteria bacterium]|nr:hypothetical protein [Candidatus Paceibacterota bacterium]